MIEIALALTGIFTLIVVFLGRSARTKKLAQQAQLREKIQAHRERVLFEQAEKARRIEIAFISELPDFQNLELEQC